MQVDIVVHTIHVQHGTCTSYTSNQACNLNFSYFTLVEKLALVYIEQLVIMIKSIN